MTFMGVNGYTKCSLMINKIRQKSLGKLEKKQKRKLIRLFQQTVFKATHAFLPDYANKLIYIYAPMRDLIPEDTQQEGFFKGIAACRKGSMEKSLIRAIVVGCVRGMPAQTMRDRDFANADEIRELACSKTGTQNIGGDDDVDDDDDEIDKLVISKKRKRSGNFRCLYDNAEQDW